jgi:hypothetical protein
MVMGISQDGLTIDAPQHYGRSESTADGSKNTAFDALSAGSAIVHAALDRAGRLVAGFLAGDDERNVRHGRGVRRSEQACSRTRAQSGKIFVGWARLRVGGMRAMI